MSAFQKDKTIQEMVNYISLGMIRDQWINISNILVHRETYGIKDFL